MLMKQGRDGDGVLSWLHTSILVLMDDTATFAMSTQNLVKKLTVLHDHCTEYGLRISETKTNFFVVNGERGNKELMHLNGLTVSWCNSYIYLESPFTCDGNVSHSVKLHAGAKLPHVHKFVSFINKNNDVPFAIKRWEFDAVLTSMLLYSCESRINAD